MIRRPILLALAAVLVLAWMWMPGWMPGESNADAGPHGACQHNCRCSRLDYFDRLLPSAIPGRGSNDALGTVQRTVGLLLADPSTDWSAVRINRLRQQLVDLNEIMMYARTDEREVPGGLEITVDGEERIREALERVVPEHIRSMDGFRGWSVELDPGGDALRLRITSEHADETEIIRGFGFFGFLASGVHRPHRHLAAARGVSP